MKVSVADKDFNLSPRTPRMPVQLIVRQWLQDQGQAVINELQTIRRVLHE